jgi:hypothetical protein
VLALLDCFTSRTGNLGLGMGRGYPLRLLEGEREMTAAVVAVRMIMMVFLPTAYRRRMWRIFSLPA